MAVPSEGSTEVVSNYGTLTVQSDGSYSYQPIGSNNLKVGVTAHEPFTYTQRTLLRAHRFRRRWTSGSTERLLTRASPSTSPSWTRRWSSWAKAWC